MASRLARRLARMPCAPMQNLKRSIAMTETIKLTSPADGFAFTALHAEAQGTRRGGIVVIQEIFGLDKYMHEDVERWAAKGFEAIAPSLYDRQEPGFTAEHNPEGMQTGFKYAMANGVDSALSDVQACVDALKDKGPVFIVGYCYGGWIVWEAAHKVNGLAAGSSYYGGRIKDRADIDLHVPVICHFGRKDAHIPADEVKAAIEKAHPDVPVYIYEGSGHGFNNDGVEAQDPADAALARERTLDWFAKHGA
jgi:carboxymethylenebutenolidase